MTESIFRGIVTSENSYAQLLSNLLRRDAQFCLAVLERLLGDRTILSPTEIRITPQKRLPGRCGQPDLVIESPRLYLIVEVKTERHRLRTKSQELRATGTYLSFLCKQRNAGRKAALVFLVPRNWKFSTEVTNGTFVCQRQNSSKISVRKVYWEDILELLSLDRVPNGDSLPSEFRLLLSERFGPISFAKEEVTSMFSSEFPMQTVLKLNATLQQLRDKAGKRASTPLHCDKDETGFSLKRGQRPLLFVGFWLPFWEANHYPLCFGVDEQNTRAADSFRRSFRKLYSHEPISCDQWLMGWATDDDLTLVSAADEIWEKLEPIWNSVRGAAG